MFLSQIISPSPPLLKNVMEKVILTTAKKQEWPPTRLKGIQENIIFQTYKKQAWIPPQTRKLLVYIVQWPAKQYLIHDFINCNPVTGI